MGSINAWSFYPPTTNHQIGESYLDHFWGRTFVIMKRTADGTGYEVFPVEKVEEWNGFAWTDYQVPGAPAYRLKVDHTYVAGPNPPSVNHSALNLGTFNKLLRGMEAAHAKRATACKHERVNDTGFSAYCYQCDAKMRLVDMQWVAVEAQA